jgi:thioredoxin 1
MAGEHVLELTDANFEAEVMQSDLPVLVDFGADWCIDCRMIASTIDEIAATYLGRAKIGKLHIDRRSATAQRYGIGVIPTLIFFSGGLECGKLVNVKDKRRITEMLDHVLDGAAPAS